MAFNFAAGIVYQNPPVAVFAGTMMVTGAIATKLLYDIDIATRPKSEMNAVRSEMEPPELT